LWAVSLGWAQEPPTGQPEDLFDLSIEQLMEVDVGTVYAASKYEQKTADAPSSVTIITADQIKKYGWRTLREILESVPGFYSTYDRNYGYLGVRGFGRPGDFNSRILMLIDGYRLNDSIGNSWGLTREFHLDTDMIKRVEIVCGPGSALYGSNAFFAVINVITKGAADAPGTEIAAGYDSRDAARERLSYGNKFKNGLDLLVSASRYDVDGEALYFPEFDDPATHRGWADNDRERADHLFVKTAVSDFTLTVAHSDREKGVPTAPWETVFNHSGTDTRDAFTLIGLSWQKTLDDDWSVLGKVSYNHYNYSGRWFYDDGGIYLNRDWWKARWWVGELQLTKTFSDRNRLTFGAEAQYNVREDQKNWDSEIYLYSRRHSKSWGMYIQDEWKLFDNVTLFSGVRQDYFESTGHKLSPRLALVYRPVEDTSIKLLFGKAFRAPSPYELYYEDGLTTRTNPDLKEETIKTYEIVWEQKLGSRWHGSLSGYYYKAKNLIDQTEDSGGWTIYDNLDEVTAKGAQAALEGRWEGGMRARLGYAWVQTLNKTTRSALANSPKHMITANWICPILPDRLFAGIETKYISKRKTLADAHTDDAVITNLTLTYENLLGNLDVQMGIYNLLDEAYDHPAFLEHTQDVIEQDGRTVGVKVFYRF
jgi:iron complex outermembrane receptor protein